MGLRYSPSQASLSFRYDFFFFMKTWLFHYFQQSHSAIPPSICLTYTFSNREKLAKSPQVCVNYQLVYTHHFPEDGGFGTCFRVSSGGDTGTVAMVYARSHNDYPAAY